MEIQDFDWFYVQNFSLGTISLSNDEARHLKVKRHYGNETIVVFDGKGKVGIAKIISEKKVNVESIQQIPDESFLTIATATPKGDKLDFMLQKLTELNVSKIILMITKHSVVIPKLEKKERFERILLEACKQCKRATVPELSIMNFSDVLKLKCENKFIFEQNSKKLNNKKGKTLVLIGPEGGFMTEELSEAEKSGFVKTSIAKNTLRIETAAIAASAIINNI